MPCPLLPGSHYPSTFWHILCKPCHSPLPMHGAGQEYQEANALQESPSASDDGSWNTCLHTLWARNSEVQSAPSPGSPQQYVVPCVGLPFFSESFLPSPPVLTAVTSQINYLHSHPCPTVCFLRGSELRKTLHKSNPSWELPLGSGPQTQDFWVW